MSNPMLKSHAEVAKIERDAGDVSAAEVQDPHPRRIPELRDPRWEAWAIPLLSFLEQPRDWTAIGTWACANHADLNLVRNMLAWADHHHRAEPFYRGDVIYWAARGVSSVQLLDSDRELDEQPTSGHLLVGEQGGDEASIQGPSECIVRAR